MLIRLLLALFLLAGTWKTSSAGESIFSSLDYLADDIDWTGVFAGISATRNWGHLDTNGDDTAIDNNNKGVTLVGAFGGVRWETPLGVVLGAQVEGPFYGFGGGANDTVFFAAPAFMPPVEYRWDVNWAIFVSGQIGYAIGRVLPYFEFGYGKADVEYKVLNVSPTNTYAPGSRQKTSHVHDLWKVGGGVDVAVLDNVVVGLDFAYMAAGRESYDVPWLLPGPNNIGADAFSAGGSVSIKFP